uniref:Uncharacterized protein n=1 Tax=viral metagenome TaxID=1070528 RepID=A0A6C0JVY6_9ZZZZ
MQTVEIDRSVANVIQMLVFSEYMVVQSIVLYNTFLTIFAITDVTNMPCYFGLLAFSFSQWICNGITYRLTKGVHDNLIVALKILFTVAALGEIILISCMFQFVVLNVLVKVVFCLILIKDIQGILIGIIGAVYIRKWYANHIGALDYHRDTMRRLGQHGFVQYDYKLN